MSDNHQLVAYLATLAAIVLLVAIAAILAGLGKYSEAIGVGGAITGLIGVIRLPSARAPVATTDTGDVNVDAKP